MEYLPVVSKLFADDPIESPQKKDGTYKIILEEKDKNARLREVTIEDMPETCRAIKLDMFKLNNKFLRGEKGELRRCDYVLFIKHKKELYRYFIEIKSAKPRGYDTQLKASACLMKYFDILAKHFHSDTSMELYKDRFVLLKRGGIKADTSPEPYEWENNSYDSCYEIEFDDVEVSISLAKLLAERKLGPLAQAYDGDRVVD